MGITRSQSFQIFNHSNLGQRKVSRDIENLLFCLSGVCKILEIHHTKQVRDSIDDGFQKKGGGFYITLFKTSGWLQNLPKKLLDSMPSFVISKKTK
ncbi:hypothetical protein BKH41_03005 [Helicobacter sp. 12S02232-10]|uniref:hypothetical protein n=1 Tax=Helicobacter sp. 12S02232-10 TaxID=1476197 RepID=UPI000BA7792F|nr:hypothetical protein [Helicobacter sp. 12S02232-10]PAF49075.1 hypothetical protein BKH41_03005 [Helicobacter sp. 12S02232-10]